MKNGSESVPKAPILYITSSFIDLNLKYTDSQILRIFSARV